MEESLALSKGQHPITSVVCKGLLFLCSSIREVFIVSYGTLSVQESFNFNEDVACIATDPFEISSPQTFTVGYPSGRISLHYFGKYSWFNKSGQTLFAGLQAPVTSLYMVHNYVLWSDELQFFVMQMTHKEIVFRMAFITYSPSLDIVIPHLILTRNSDASPEDRMQSVYFTHFQRVSCISKSLKAKSLFEISYEQELPCLALHISHFDATSVCIIGYPIMVMKDNYGKALNRTLLRLLVFRSESGETVCSQNLVLDHSLNLKAQHFILSTYDMPSRKLDYMKWKLDSQRNQRVVYLSLINGQMSSFVGGLSRTSTNPKSGM